MAKNIDRVYLGYEDEFIKNYTSYFTTNKIGGYPDWILNKSNNSCSKCPLCGLYRMLVVQCYAPLDNSTYHRTLYVFGCLSPNCWTQSESWVCLRSQTQVTTTSSSADPSVVSLPDVNWCSGADEWDENDNRDLANGNILNVDNMPSPNQSGNKFSDEDEESNSLDVDTVEQAMGNLQVFDAHNANMSPIKGAAGGDLVIATPAAELEGGDEPGLVSVDTPSAPDHQLYSILQQTAELPVDLRSRLQCGPLQFAPKFIYVEEEYRKSAACTDDKVLDLLNKYKNENEMEVSGVEGAPGGTEDEHYEEAAPLHGDKLFHAFLTRLRENPGQILRYSREAPPLLGAPITSESSPIPQNCTRCNSKLICELQLLPNFADALRVLPGDIALNHLHFLSVLIFTCEQSCWQPGDTFVKETVLFQPEI